MPDAFIHKKATHSPADILHVSSLLLSHVCFEARANASLEVYSHARFTLKKREDEKKTGTFIMQSDCALFPCILRQRRIKGRAEARATRRGRRRSRRKG